MNTSVNQTSKRLGSVGLLVVLILLSSLGYTERFFNICGLQRLEDSNQTYLQNSFDRSLRLFAVLSAVKVGLAIIEGSEVGVGFGLELGDAVQSVYDHVDVAWRTVLLAGVILMSMEYLLETADLLDQTLLTVALIALVFWLVCGWWFPSRYKTRRTIRDFCLLITVLTTVLYIVLPLSVAGGSWLSDRITRPSLNRAEQGLVNIQRDLLAEEPREEGLFGALNATKERIVEMTLYLKDKATEIVVLLITVIAVYLFDCVLFPAVLFMFLLWTARWAVRYLFNAKQTQNFKEDLEQILKRAYNRTD